MREHGWDAFDAFIIDVCVTDDRDVLEEMEKQYIWDLKPTMNTNDYTFDRKQYKIDNAEYIRKQKQYKIDNRDRLNANKRHKRLWIKISQQFRMIMM